MLCCITAGTPYEDGTFRMKMILGPDFPNTPPKGTHTSHLLHLLLQPVMSVLVLTTPRNNTKVFVPMLLYSALAMSHQIL